MKPHVEGVIPNFTVTRSSSQTVHPETSFSDRVAGPCWSLSVTMPGKDRGSYAFIKERWLPAHTHTHTHTHTRTHTHVELKCHYLAGSSELNETEEKGKGRKKETEMVLNSFIIQMNENHINASRQGRASVSKLAHQLCEEANEGRGLSVAIARSRQKGFWFHLEERPLRADWSGASWPSLSELWPP